MEDQSKEIKKEMTMLDKVKAAMLDTRSFFRTTGTGSASEAKKQIKGRKAQIEEQLRKAGA